MFEKLLADYRNAVRATAWAENHGTWSDSRLRDAQEAEARALRALKSYKSN